MVEQAKIPVTIGFANLTGDNARALVKNDRDALAPLFATVAEPPIGQIPKVPVLFLYAELEPGGTVRGTTGGIRQIAEAAGAKLLVLATENSDESVLNTGKLAGPKLANLVLTNNRNGIGLTRFFHELFTLMLAGKEFLAAYVLLAPQGAKPATWLPGTIVLAEAGRLVFPASGTSAMGVTRNALLGAMLDTSPGDRSMLEVALRHMEPDQVRLTTAMNTMNFRLWSQMAQLGWLAQGPDATVPEAPSVQIKSFSITDKGRAALPDFLAEFAKHQIEHSAKMIEVFNSVCLPFARNSREQILQAGGKGGDIQKLTALTLAQLISDAYRPEFRLHAVEAIAKSAKDRVEATMSVKPSVG